MNPKKIRKECDALKTIRGRWQLRGWKFTPLERIDGVNETLESIDTLRNSPVCWSSFSREHNIEELLENLEDAYRYALEPWGEHRTVFDGKGAQREFLRWPEGMFSAHIQRDARYRFWELVTTSRFSVNAVPSVFELQGVNWPSEKITLRHVVSLAAMVCIIEAIQSLEQIEYWWREDSRPYRAGKPFEWLSKNDPGKMDVILSVMLETPKEIEPHKGQIRDSLEALEHADAWLAHLTTMNFGKQEVERSAKEAVAEKSKKAQASAETPRKGKGLTLEVLADYFNARPGEKQGPLLVALSELHEVSERTVSRRYQKAKENNLLS
jgi:hypothetical protein